MQTTFINRGATSQIIHVFLTDSTATTGAGKTGLAYNTSGLVIAAIKPGDAAPVTYKVADSKIEDITTLGTFAAPSTDKIRFKELDSTNLPGWYELQIANSLVPGIGNSAPQLVLHIFGASNLRPETIQVVLSLPLVGSGANQIAVDGSGRANTDVTAIGSSASAATILGALHAAVISAEVLGTPAANDFDGSTSLSSVNDTYNDMFLLFTSGANAGLCRKITDYIGADRTFLFQGAVGELDRAFPNVPSAGDDFLVFALGV